MEKQDSIDRRVARAFDLLDQPEALPPAAPLYEQVRVVLDARRTSSRLRASAGGSLLVVLLLLMNLLVVRWTLTPGMHAITGDDRQQLLDALAVEFNIDAPSAEHQRPE